MTQTTPTETTKTHTDEMTHLIYCPREGKYAACVLQPDNSWKLGTRFSPGALEVIAETSVETPRTGEFGERDHILAWNAALEFTKSKGGTYFSSTFPDTLDVQEGIQPSLDGKSWITTVYVLQPKTD